MMSDLLYFIFVAVWSSVLLLLGLASFNATLGVRKKYVEILLKIFEVLFYKQIFGSMKFS